jgi:hypothetical protein
MVKNPTIFTLKTGIIAKKGMVMELFALLAVVNISVVYFADRSYRRFLENEQNDDWRNE